MEKPKDTTPFFAIVPEVQLSKLTQIAQIYYAIGWVPELTVAND